MMAHLQKALENLRDEVIRVKKLDRWEYRRTRTNCQDNLRSLVKTVDLQLEAFRVRVDVEQMRLLQQYVASKPTIRRQNEQVFHQEYRVAPCRTEDLDPSQQPQVDFAGCLGSVPQDIHTRLEPYCGEDSKHSKQAEVAFAACLGSIPQEIHTGLEPYYAQDMNHSEQTEIPFALCLGNIPLNASEHGSPSETTKAPLIHHNHRCDICHTKPIVGRRFGATHLPDCDFCEKCRTLYHGTSDDFFEVYFEG